jgi:type IX secretion system PorP/SprF family membrane protein
MHAFLNHMHRLRLPLLLVAFFGAAGSPARAQQVPLSSNYLYNEFLVNPAAVGLHGQIDINGYYRRHFADIPGAPVTQVVTADGFFERKSFGIGIQAFNHSAGVMNETGIGGAYAYQKYLSSETALRAGLSGEISRYGIDWEEVNVENPSDLGRLRGIQHSTLFDGGFGIYLTNPNFDLGVSMTHLFNSEADFVAGDNSQRLALEQNRHITALGAYKFAIGESEDFELRPVALGQYAPEYDIQYDITLQAIYLKDIYANIGYRSDYAITGGLGIRLQERFFFGYNYDFPTSEVADISQGSHEFMLGFRVADKGTKGRDELSDDINYLKNMQKRIRNRQDSMDGRLGEQEDLNERQQEAIDDLQDLIEENGRKIDSILKGGPRQQPGQQGGNGGQRPGTPGQPGGGETGDRSYPSEKKDKSTYNIRDIEPADVPNPYKLIVASFSQANNAVRYQQELKRLGFNGSIEIYRCKEGPYFRDGEWNFIAYRQFSNPDDAQQALNRLETGTGKDVPIIGEPWIYVVPK